MSSKIYAICGGGDWADASVDHLVIPNEVNIDSVYKEYKTWMHDVWFKSREKGEKYYSLVTWLIEKHGARRPTDDELDVFQED